MIEDALSGGAGVSMADSGAANASSSNNAEDKWLRKYLSILDLIYLYGFDLIAAVDYLYYSHSYVIN